MMNQDGRGRWGGDARSAVLARDEDWGGLDAVGTDAGI
jgi:hypothetical protein